MRPPPSFRSRSHWSLVGLALACACTPDVLTTSSSGGGGGASSSSTGSSATSTSNTTGSTSGTSGTTSASSTSSASSASSTDASSSASGSTGSGMPTKLAHCTNVVDDFDGYVGDMDFTQHGETLGPWAELVFSGSSQVKWDLSMIRLDGGGGSPVLYLKTPFDPPALAPCIFTVDLVSLSDSAAIASFRLAKDQTARGIEYVGGALTFDEATPVAVSLPATLGLSIDGGHLYGYYSSNGGATWTALEPTIGIPIPVALMTGATVGMTQSGNAISRWDNFNTHANTPDVSPP